MKIKRLSLGNLIAAWDSQFGSKDASEKKEGKKTEEGSETKTEEGSDEGDSADSDQDKKEETTEKKSEGTEAPKEENKEASEDTQPKSVMLSESDYNKIADLASEAVTLRAENKNLKSKADQWDSYQGALKGIKPGADTAGAKTTDSEGDSKDPHAELRQKHPRLMEGL